MSAIWYLCLWTLFITHAGPAQCSTIQFLARDEGESVVFPCLIDPTEHSPIGVYLKRSWLRRNNVLFKYKMTEVAVLDLEYQNRTSVSGDPSIHSLNVTISDLRPSDTDRYYCEFNLDNPHSGDLVQPGKTEFFLLVNGEAPADDRELVNTCVGGSALVSCVPPVGDSSAVEGVILKRQRGGQPVELLYHSKYSSWSSQFSVDRVQLSTAPGPGGISYSLTVGQLQSEDSGLYSCQLLVQGRPPTRSIGHQGLYVSVQGDQCRCSSYSALIYALSAAVAVTFVLILVVVLMHMGKRRRAVTTHTPAPIYEEMTRLQPTSPKRSRDHLEETQSESSEYKNISVKKTCPENHYESPKGALAPHSEGPQ